MSLKDNKDESSLSLHGIEFHIFGPINEKALLPINVDVVEEYIKFWLEYSRPGLNPSMEK